MAVRTEPTAVPHAVLKSREMLCACMSDRATALHEAPNSPVSFFGFVPELLEMAVLQITNDGRKIAGLEQENAKLRARLKEAGRA